MYSGKVTTRVTIHIKNLVATKSWALPEPSLSHSQCVTEVQKVRRLEPSHSPMVPTIILVDNI